MKTYVIGDIHGAYRALQQVIQRAGLEPEDRLIFLGDYVDGWSQSRQVIEFLMDMDASYDCIFLRGNHDTWCEEWLEGLGPDPSWLFHGGKATIDSYAGITPAELDRHLEFFNRMRWYYEEAGRLFIHAGFSSMHGPAQEPYVSNFGWDRTLWEMALAVDDRIPRDSIFYPRRLLLYQEIYIGHTPTTNYDLDIPMQCCNVWNIDTGAAFTGRISMIDIATKKVIQSDIVQQLYPDESGRNKVKLLNDEDL
ncbi:metallophosphoesterase family protein [Puia dinghuensis]|uniref:Metallophosphatase n=1 Tax=Puia dinghuensis TaxID=1792502 RepID=A0A8J2U9U6_9BACT|nr:metallophosphoesterase family protein [Puia dinghuensis]GGA89026.1 metallophosphatase [Puia dinghuensis]